MSDDDLIDYRHREDVGNATRFIQRRCDPLPVWAEDVQPHFAALPADDRVEKLVEALKPFARIADVSETAEPGESVTVNVDRCRAARAAIAAWEAGE
jgi:hypothetical protein